jgi:ArsR family transcriptional regulator
MTLDPTQLSEHAKDVAAMLKLMSNPFRLMILCCLSEGEQTVGQLNTQIELSQSALSQHLTKLRESKLVETRRESQTIYYRIKDIKTKELLSYLQQNFCGNT